MDSITALAATHSQWVDARQRVTAENIANVDTPDFARGRTPDFATALEGTAKPFAMNTSHPSHIAALPDAPGFGTTRGGAVSLQSEMVDLGQNRRAHDLNTAISAAFHRFHMSVAR